MNKTRELLKKSRNKVMYLVDKFEYAIRGDVDMRDTIIINRKIG